MSNFGAKLAELLERNNLRAADLGRLTGFSDALISKWINGQQSFVDVGDLETICACLSSNPKEHAELVRAHLQDEIPARVNDLIDIRIKGQGAAVLKEENAPYMAALPLKIQRAFELLSREVITDADVRGVILGLANLLDNGTNSGRQMAEDYADDSLERHEPKRVSPRKPSAKPPT